MGETRRLFLVDGYALIYRAFFAMLSRPLTTSRGENTSVPWGIVNFLLRLRGKHHPDFVAWVHDAGTSFRHTTYPEYKATREKLDEELQQDFNRSLTRVETLLGAFRVPLVAIDGWEADDVIATLAARAAAEGLDVVIVSGDKDFYQLIGPHIALLNPGRGGPAAVEEQFVTTENATERLGVPPGQTVDFLALVGDSADNVPGVTGVGEKTAQKLLAEYGSLDTILERAGDVSAKRAREALQAEADRARLSRELVTLRRDAPVELDLGAFALREPDWNTLIEVLRELEFHSLVRSLTERLGAPPPAPAAAAGSRARIADTPVLVREAVAAARRAGLFGLGVQASSPEPMRAALVGLALATGDGAPWYLPFAHRASGGMFERGAVCNLPPATDPRLAPLAELLADPAVAKVGHNLKDDGLVLRRAGLALRGVVFDAMIASFMIDPGKRSHELDVVVGDEFGEHLRSREDLVGKGKAERPFTEVPVAEAADYGGTRAEYALRLKARLELTLEEHALAPLFRDVELPLIAVLADMEWEGIAIDADQFARLTQEFRRELAELEQAIHRAALTDFNILSTPQLRHVLFEKLQLPVLKKTKTGASTDFEVLEELAAMGHEVPKLLIEYREVSKLLSTYLEALPAQVNPETGRIHTSFNPIGAATGRLSSTNPNLQNIPVRTARGESIRRGFVPRPGAKLVVADYSQIELRLLAHLSGDPAFVAAFRAGGDIHRQTAAVIFGVDAAAVTADQRSRAKTINFATIYGQGPHALARQLGIAHDEAKRFIAGYFARFAGVRRYLDEAVASAREKGYAETILGRRRYIPELKDKNHNVRSFGERVATNAPIQGSAADLIKIAMVRVAAALRERFSARLLLQVHDELVVEAPAREADEVAGILLRHMEGVADLAVPLVADVGIGANWLDAKAG
ncbi:MAG: DNA polymerase I [Gemmatimonadetes bacterium GWC2_71_9]|nr:MAG: DNA polymerase I [Gemmatimonadetes bacterium GWC2_71_9]